MARREACMKIAIDLNLCEGNARCAGVAPEVFELRDDNKSHLLIERPAEHLRAKISRRRACVRGRRSQLSRISVRKTERCIQDTHGNPDSQ
jgi:ferredoxin